MGVVTGYGYGSGDGYGNGEGNGEGDMLPTQTDSMSRRYSAEAIDLAVMLDDIAEKREHRIKFAQCVLLLSGTMAFSEPVNAPSPAAAPKPSPDLVKQKPSAPSRTRKR
jgi:hypothetical protein